MIIPNRKEGESHIHILGIFAHPDDESFAIGGTLIAASRLKFTTGVLCLTKGEAGNRSNNQDSTVNIKIQRTEELLEAARRLKLDFLRLLSLPDDCLNKFEDILSQIILQELTSCSVSTAITMYQNATGHPDHHAVTQATIKAVEELRGFGRNINLLLQFNPQRLSPASITKFDLEQFDSTNILIPGTFGTIYFGYQILVEKIYAISAHKSQAKDANRIIPHLLPREYFRVG